jgi:hypothetical protein
MLVRDEFKYVWYADERPSLFDLSHDPDELVDLATDGGHADLLAEFEKSLRSIVDLEKATYEAKQGMGLIGAAGQDYTKSHRASRVPGQTVPVKGKDT